MRCVVLWVRNPIRVFSGVWVRYVTDLIDGVTHKTVGHGVRLLSQ